MMKLAIKERHFKESSVRDRFLCSRANYSYSISTSCAEARQIFRKKNPTYSHVEFYKNIAHAPRHSEWVKLRTFDFEELKTERKFNDLAQTWRKETGMLSVLEHKVMHPAYQQIIAMSKDALPFIFKDLQKRSGHWIWALESILPEANPAKEEATFKEAVAAWLNYGKEKGYIQ